MEGGEATGSGAFVGASSFTVSSSGLTRDSLEGGSATGPGDLGAPPVLFSSPGCAPSLVSSCDLVGDSLKGGSAGAGDLVGVAPCRLPLPCWG